MITDYGHLLLHYLQTCSRKFKIENRYSSLRVFNLMEYSVSKVELCFILIPQYLQIPTQWPAFVPHPPTPPPYHSRRLYIATCIIASYFLLLASTELIINVSERNYL